MKATNETDKVIPFRDATGKHFVEPGESVDIHGNPSGAEQMGLTVSPGSVDPLPEPVEAEPEDKPKPKRKASVTVREE